VNSWFDRYLKSLGAGDSVLHSDEAELVLKLAGEAAHTSGARPYAPLAAYLAGRAAAGLSREGRLRVLELAVSSAVAAGPAGEEPEPD
jgi:hypothetical protein